VLLFGLRRRTALQGVCSRSPLAFTLQCIALWAGSL